MGTGARKIIHVDMDAFYAAIEQRDRPELRGRPVVVGGRPDSRGVVCSASYEARAFGVRSAMGSFKAAKLCPQAVFVQPDFERYQAASRLIQAIFLDYTDLVEPLSLDEAYLDVTVNKLAEPSATRIAEIIRARIRAETGGLTASAGVAPNKFAAKAASDRNKPDGIFVVRPEHLAAFAAALPVGAVPGVGRVTGETCQRLGIVTAGDFLKHPPEQLERWFGSSARWFADVARGIDERPVCAERERKSVGAEETFARDLADPVEAGRRIASLSERVAQRLHGAGVRARTVTLKATYHDFTRVTRSRTLESATDQAAAISAVAVALLPLVAIDGRPVRLLGVSCSHLDDQPGRQEVLDFVDLAPPPLAPGGEGADLSGWSYVVSEY